MAVEVSGIEPPTSSLRTTRSSQLSYTPEGMVSVSSEVANLGGYPGCVQAEPREQFIGFAVGDVRVG